MAASQVGVLVTTESQVALFDRCLEALIGVVDDEEQKEALHAVSVRNLHLKFRQSLRVEYISIHRSFLFMDTCMVTGIH